MKGKFSKKNAKNTPFQHKVASQNQHGIGVYIPASKAPPPLVGYQSGGNHGSLQESKRYNVMFKSLKDPGEEPSPAFPEPEFLVEGLKLDNVPEQAHFER